MTVLSDNNPLRKDYRIINSVFIIVAEHLPLASLFLFKGLILPVK